MENETPLIYERIAMVMADIGHIGKDQTNKAQSFKYRGIDDVYNALHAIMAKHQVFTTPEVMEKSREERTNQKGTVLAFTTLRIRYTFYTVDGSSVSCVVEGEGMDSGDKSSNKAMAIAHKYAMLQTFMIPTDEIKDPDAESHEVRSRLKDAIEQHADSITAIKDGLASGDLSSAAEAWFELTDDEKKSIWVAPTKGGPFTTKEREIMKSTEFREAHHGSAE